MAWNVRWYRFLDVKKMSWWEHDRFNIVDTQARNWNAFTEKLNVPRAIEITIKNRPFSIAKESTCLKIPTQPSCRLLELKSPLSYAGPASILMNHVLNFSPVTMQLHFFPAHHRRPLYRELRADCTPALLLSSSLGTSPPSSCTTYPETHLHYAVLAALVRARSLVTAETSDVEMTDPSGAEATKHGP